LFGCSISDEAVNFGLIEYADSVFADRPVCSLNDSIETISHYH
jgi:hypothetical protein